MTYKKGEFCQRSIIIAIKKVSYFPQQHCNIAQEKWKITSKIDILSTKNPLENSLLWQFFDVKYIIGISPTIAIFSTCWFCTKIRKMCSKLICISNQKKSKQPPNSQNHTIRPRQKKAIMNIFKKWTRIFTKKRTKLPSNYHHYNWILFKKNIIC